jgi:hypothetical protein
MGNMCATDRKTNDQTSSTGVLFGDTSTSACGKRTDRTDLAYTSTGPQNRQNPGWYQSQSDYDFEANVVFGGNSAHVHHTHLDDDAFVVTHVKKGKH